MKQLNYELKQLSKYNRDGSHATQADRERNLSYIANTLHEMGYRRMHANSLKPKHIDALVAHWKDQELSTGRIKNLMASIRWWAAKVGKQNVVARSNDHYGIPDRQYSTGISKAKTISNEEFLRVKDVYVRMSLELQREFGLRREEAMKIQPSYADKGNKLVLKDSWTKGGKQREIPIRTDSQRNTLDRAHKLAGKGSLIPPNRSYIQQVKIYERHCANAGLSKMHGLRHEYAQTRYVELTTAQAQKNGLNQGWKPPAAEGPSRRELTPAQREIDREVRLEISRELGHERMQITVVYLG